MRKTDFPDVPAFTPVPSARGRTGIPDADSCIRMWPGWAVKEVDIHPGGGHQVTLIRNGTEIVVHMHHGQEVSRSEPEFVG